MGHEAPQQRVTGHDRLLPVEGLTTQYTGNDQVPRGTVVFMIVVSNASARPVLDCESFGKIFFSHFASASASARDDDVAGSLR